MDLILTPAADLYLNDYLYCAEKLLVVE